MKKVLVLAFLIAVATVARAEVSAKYLGTDVEYKGTQIQGNWVGVVGEAGYHLLYWGSNESHASYPSFLNTAQPVNLATWQWQAPETTDEAKAVLNSTGDQRCASSWVSNGIGYIHINMTETASFIMGVYLLDYDSYGPRSSAIAVCDSATEAAYADEQTVDSYTEGAWLFYQVSGEAGDMISIRVKNLSSNATVAMLSFDKASTAVSSFVVTDPTSDCPTVVNDPFLNVKLTGEPAEGMQINGYMITETPDTPAADSTEWGVAPPSSYLFVAPEGEVTLYGWVRDDQNNIAGKAVTFLYSTAVPVVSDLAVNILTSDSALATYTTDALTAGRIKYRAVGTTEWSYTRWESTAAQEHSIKIPDLVRDTSYELVVQNGDAEESPITYGHLVGLVEIPKDTMKVYTDSVNYGNETDAINGNAQDVGWYAAAKSAYLMLEVAHRAEISTLEYQPRPDNQDSRIKDYELYVTDDPADWGTPVATGTWENTADLQLVAFTPKAGRFFILNALTSQNIAGASELWLYGSDAPDVTAFSVADSNTGDAKFVSSPVVNVTEFVADPAGETAVGYMITEAGDVPTPTDGRWAATAPTEYVITGALPEQNPRYIDLYAWIKTAAGTVAHGSKTRICYSSLALAEVPKEKMTARASSIGYGRMANAIDGNFRNFWLTHEKPAWLQLDLGGRYTVGSLLYQGRPDSSDARAKEYEVYVTDVPDDPSAWGDPVATGTFANSIYTQEIVTSAKTGRYVVLNLLSFYSGDWIGASEVNVYAAPAVEVSDFAVADQATGSGMFVNSPVANVSLFEVQTQGEAVTGYVVTEEGDVPDAADPRWSAEIPATFVITGDAPAAKSRPVTLRGWVRTESGLIGSSAPFTVFLTSLPLAEVPKGDMNPTATNSSWGVPANMINETIGDYWLARPVGAYLQLDLGGRYNVGHISFMNRIDDFQHRAKDYNIYVTDTPDQLSGLVASGTFSSNEQRQEIILEPKVGRYVIVEFLSNWGDVGVGGSEIWVYGARSATITDFQIADTDTGSTTFINSPTISVTSFQIDAAGDPVAAYLIAEPGQTPGDNDPRWQPEVPSTYTFEMEPPTDTFVNLVGWIKTFSGQMIVSAPCRIFYTPLPMAEVPKAQMQVVGSNSLGEYMDFRAINNADDTGWICPDDTGELLIDLGGRYNVGMFVYLARPDASDGNIQDYNIYVTDDPEVSGAPVALGVWPKSDGRKWTPLTAKEGRYVILEAVSKYSNWISVSELEIYGVPTADVPEFSVADQTTGSDKFITSTTIDVTSFVPATGDDPVVEYAIAADPYQPLPEDSIWQASIPSTHTLTFTPMKNSYVSVRGWVKTASGKIACSKAQRLFYSDYEFTQIPNEQLLATAKSETFNGVDYPASRVFDGGFENENQCWLGGGPEQWLQIDLGESSSYKVGYIDFFQRQNHTDGWIKDYQIYVTDDPANWGEAVVTGQLESNRTMKPIFVPPTAGRYVIFNAPTIYGGPYTGIGELQLYSAEEVQTQPTWPIEGDANMDCKVNIIDLIFIRNRLNKDTTTGDNWQADVNGDGKVNIIDLIYVRNRLNSRCE